MSFKSSDNNSSGFTIYSPNANWKLVFSNGLLSIQDSFSTIFWKSKQGASTNTIRLQRDGHLIMFDSGGNIIWLSEASGAQDGNHSLTISDCGIAKITLESGYIFTTLPRQWYSGNFSFAWNYQPKSILNTILNLYADQGYSDKIKTYSGLALKTNKLQSGEILINNSSISYYGLKLIVTNNAIKITNGTTEVYNKAISTEATKIDCALSMNIDGTLRAYSTSTIYSVFDHAIATPKPGMYMVLGENYGISIRYADNVNYDSLLSYTYTLSMFDKCIPWTNTDECTKYLIDNKATSEYNTTNYQTLLNEKIKYIQTKFNTILKPSDLDSEKTFLSKFPISDISSNLTSVCEEIDPDLTTVCKEIYNTNSTNDKIKNSIKKINIMNCNKNNNFINSNCSTVVANNPEIYLDKMKTYCNTPSNYVSSVCTDYYKNIKDTIVNSLNSKILSSFSNNDYENINYHYDYINYDYWSNELLGNSAVVILFFIIVFFIIFIIKKNKKEIIYKDL